MIRLSSGRELDLIADTIGINLKKGTIHSGHDETIDVERDEGFIDTDVFESFTPDERRELAVIAVEAWIKWAYGCRHTKIINGLTREICGDCGAQRHLRVLVDGNIVERGPWFTSCVNPE